MRLVATDGKVECDNDVHGYSIIFNDVSNPETIRGNGTESEQTKGRITTIGGRQNARIDQLPTRVSEQIRETRSIV
jgi:hypothetical protein